MDSQKFSQLLKIRMWFLVERHVRTILLRLCNQTQRQLEKGNINSNGRIKGIFFFFSLQLLAKNWLRIFAGSRKIFFPNNCFLISKEEEQANNGQPEIQLAFENKDMVPRRKARISLETILLQRQLEKGKTREILGSQNKAGSIPP